MFIAIFWVPVVTVDALNPVSNVTYFDVYFFSIPTEKEQQEAIEHIDEVQNEIDR